jgi:hypothetical protein
MRLLAEKWTSPHQPVNGYTVFSQNKEKPVMTLRTKRVLLTALAMSALAPAVAWAQLGKDVSGSAAMETMGGPAISASGTATVQREPTQLRLSIQILAKEIGRAHV